MNTAAEILEELLDSLEEILDCPNEDGKPHPLVDMVEEDVCEARNKLTRLRLRGAL